MASSTGKPITFVVPGQQQTTEGSRTRGAGAAVSPAGLSKGRLKQSVRVGAQRGGGGDVRMTAVPGEDVVVLHIAGGPELMLHPETARDLLLAQGERKRSRSAKGTEEPAPDEITVPTRLQWRGAEQGAATRGGTRSGIGDVLLSAVDVITDLFTDKAADFVASEVVRRVDGQVDPGVYALDAEALPPLKGKVKPKTEVLAGPGGGPLLVLVHGTFSNTSGTFSKLWTEHPQHVRALFKRYEGRVYALDHPTLGTSPIGNALTLAKVLAKDARLHLVTHSRGGLVAEVLARVCANPNDAVKAFAKDGEKGQRDELRTLAALVKEKGIRVDRIVRVACPARGTLLASKRLDAYVSVFKWTLELAGIPVAPVLVDFLGQVAKRRADPEQLPGLAAQIPDSPLVRWLHAVNQPMAGELRVVAGDIEGDSVTSWLKTLLADAFYWADNDFVVQTRSMYGGAPRVADASFVLDQGGNVSHFSYFSNERTAGAIVNALVQSEPEGFRTIGPLSWAGQSSAGVRAARSASDGKPAREKPAVFVLPDVLGSNLRIKGERIWLGSRLIDGLERLQYDPGKDGVEPDGLIDLLYEDLADFLSATHDVVEFAFDWRRPIEDEARRLATAVEAALAAREKSGKPVRFVAHGMGGLVARTMQLERPKVWQRMMAVPGARLLMLGTPNGGYWGPMQVLSGDDTFGNMLASVGAPFQDHAARQLMAQFPGFIQLQAALLDENLGLAKHDKWVRLADEDLERLRERSGWHNDGIQLDAYRWGVPEQGVLDRAVALRKRLDAQRDRDLVGFTDRLLLVVGKARFTPDGYEVGSAGLVYLDTPEDGDGRVPFQSAVLPGVRTWKLDGDHGSLPSKKDAFEAYSELLQNGTTSLIEPLDAATAPRRADVGAPAHVRSRPSRTRVAVTPPESQRDLLAAASQSPESGPAAAGTALRITVVNGDLTFVRQPLMLGHYRSTRLTGAEGVMNRILGGTMEDSLKAGRYPVPPGTQQVFLNTSVEPDNPWRLPRPEAVIVVGLGDEGKLRADQLVETVRQGVIAWAQRKAETQSGVPALFELAATLAGSGGGMTVGQSAQLIAQGVREANERLVDSRWPLVSHLHLIELYLNRAGEAWRALQMHAMASPGLYVVTERVEAGIGALRRTLDDGYRGADYDFISAVAQTGEAGDSGIAYTVHTKRARNEVTAQATQVSLMREIVGSAASDQNKDPQIGRTLFQLLVPLTLEPFFGGTTEMVLELDYETAGIPWELLDTKTGAGRDSRPWAIRSKLLRKLRTDEFRAHVADANAESSILVIGEPECDPKLYPRLPGARDEAHAVVDCFTRPGMLGRDRVKDLISPDNLSQVGADARTVINALFERDWRIVHIAGHGALPEKIGPVPEKDGDPPQEDGDPRGVVLSNNTFLGPREIESMRVVPELVFVNCCHLGARSTGQGLRRSGDRARFAAGVADALINVGVRCVIAAGWAVDDDAARTFATTFYGALLRGRRFIDAVAAARDAARGKGGNTWAAYQCYGDPEWTFTLAVADAQRPTPPLFEEFSGIGSSVGLCNALETLAVESTYQHAPAQAQRDKLRHLEGRFARFWGGIGEVAEAFGAAWAAAKDPASAIRWYERALAANDGTASLRTMEQVCNLRARVAWDLVEKAGRQRDEPRERHSRSRNGRGASGVKAAIVSARESIGDAIARLQKLASLQPTMERESILGSAYKRLAMVEALAGQPEAEARALASMKAHYEEAEHLGRDAQLSDSFYPAMNRMAAELALNAGRSGWKGLDSTAVAAVRQSLAAKVRDDPDFWSVVGQTELSLYEALGKRALSDKRASIEREYDDLHVRVSAQWMWASVLDQLQLVLPKYVGRTSGAERKAAEALLKHLEARARGNENEERG